ncbi:MAG: type II toxin-antitoxin system HicA family toxin [Candidatus Kapaibacteriota bacterium]|jgi:predicted RNA binding protein YcfA (HicA-like mRNA interferase family)
MSEKLPVLSARDLMRVLKKYGYEFDRQSGSHIILRQIVSPYRRATIPNHKELATGTLRDILRQTGLTIEDLRTAL